MTEKEKATGILRHYFKLKHDVNDFTIYEINNDNVYLSLRVTSTDFRNDDLRIIYIDFTDNKILGTIDIEDAREYVKTNINEVELFE